MLRIDSYDHQTPTRLKNIIIDGKTIVEGTTTRPTATVKMQLEGRLVDLNDAAITIKNAANKAKLIIHQQLCDTQTPHPYLEITLRGDAQEGPVKLLSLVHSSTQCDIGAKVVGQAIPVLYLKGEDMDEDTPPPKNKWGIFTAVEINNHHNQTTKKILVDYLDEKLRTISTSGVFETGPKCVSVTNNDAAVLLLSAMEIDGKHSAEHTAKAFAEHVGKELGILDITSQTPDR